MARRRPALAPRKAPRQRRSKVTVEAIVEAAAQVLVRHGWDGATTARIAERAGVSVGSLYQYFPSKEAILVAVARRHVEETAAFLVAALAGAADRTLEELAARLVAAAIDAHAAEPDLHRQLVAELPRYGPFDFVAEGERALVGAVVAHLETRDDVRRERLPLAVTLAYAAVDALAHRAVLDEPSLLRDPAFREELTRLVVGYLRAP